MKIKTLGRIGGIVQTSGAGFFGYLEYKLLTNTDYGKVIEVVSGDYPIGYNVVGVTIVTLDGLMAVSAVPLAVMAADGLVDTYKGAHHYLSMQIYKRILKNPQTREWVQKGIDDMMIKMEHKI